MAHRVSSRRFIGRRGELERLRAALTEAGTGESRFILIAGEAGVGKTRLVEEAAQLARQAGADVLIGGCVEVSEGAAPLAPFTEAFRALPGLASPAELDDIIGRDRAAIGLVVPAIGTDKRDHAATTAPASGQSRLFEQMLEVVTRLSARTPLLLAIEDIHWADRSTLDLLRFLTRNLRQAAVLLIASYRSDEPAPDSRLRGFLAELERTGRVERLVLDRFNRAELADQLRGILGAAARADLVDRIYGLSEGNAFYAEELVAADAEGHALPETLEEVLLARIDALSDAARSLLRIASVTGAYTTEPLLASVAGEDERTVRACLRELLERKFLILQERGGEVIAFRHALLEKTVHRQLLPRERVRLHEACARFLEAKLGDRRDPGILTEVARHWSEVGDADRALRASVRAGMAADQAHAPAEAAVQYERALRLWEEAPQAAAGLGLNRVELLERAARVESGLASARAIDHIREAIALIDPRLDPVRASLLHERLGRYRWIAGDGAGAMEAYLAATRLVPAEPPSAVRSRVSAGLGQMLMILARFEESRLVCQEALSGARASGARDVEAHALNTLGTNVAYLGDVDAGIAMLRESQAVAREIGSIEDVARGYANLLDVLTIAARFDEAIVVVEEAFAYCHAHGLTALQGMWSLNLATLAAYRSGRWADGEALLERARMYPADGEAEIERLIVGALLHVGTGAFELARVELRAAEAQVEAAIDTQLIAPFSEALARLELWTDDPDAARIAVAAGIERSELPIGANISRIGPLYALGVRAAADARLRRRALDRRTVARDEGARYLALMAEAHSRITTRWPLHVRLATPYLRICEAEATRLGDTPEPDAWRAASEALTGLGLRHAGAYASLREAQAILALHRGKAAARGPLRSADEIAVSLGAEPLRSAVAAVAERAGLQLHEVPPDDPRSALAHRFGLTRREHEVLQLLIEGRTNRQIAGELFISEKTAGAHVSNILGKLGVTGRTEAATMALRASGPVGRQV